ncbi:A disintegrin and metallo ase with thrombospondin motifs 6-like isoform X1, partial [Paramuricea clavata]
STSEGTRTSAHTRWCNGHFLEFRFCKVKDCRSNDLTTVRPKVSYQDAYRIRAQQCTEFNKKSYNGKNINWRPYLNAHLDECKLYCLAAGHKFYARLRNSVRDGTPCGKDYSNVCIKGKCQKRPRGCRTVDGPCLLEEGKKILGIFNSTALNLGYNLVATIPAGATNITIEELTRSRSYLALKDHNSETYHLNGHWRISLSKTFQLASSYVTYIRNGNTRRGGEMITIDGPLDKSLDIMVIYQRDPSVVMYSYLVAKDEYNRLKHQRRMEGQNLYFPQQGENTQPTEQTQSDRQASRLPGGEGESISFLAGRRQAPYPNTGGQRQAPYPNTGAQGGEGDSISFVAGKRQASYPSTRGQGFSYPQQSSGQRQGYGGGEQGQRGKQVSYGSSWVQFGGDGNDQPKQTSKPAVQFARRPFLNQQVYKRNQFGKSQSAPYHPGNRFDDSKRTGYRRPNSGSSTVGNRFGGQVRPETQGRTWQNPNAKKQFYTSNQERTSGVDGYIWKMVGFTPCSSSCAGGIQSGIVQCVHATTGENVADSKCNFQTRLQETRRVCNLQPCAASWVPQEWQACSKTCGEGEQVRDLMCKQTIDRNGEKVTVMLPVVKCPVRLRPEVVRKCFVRECPELTRPKWIVENWGQCSVECGHGVQRRNTVCKNFKNDTVDDSQCLWKTKPLVLKACYLGLCKADWYGRSDWSQCSKSCGSGIRTRPVVCARIDGSKLAERHCKDKTKPEDEQSCNTQHCRGIWVTSEWNKCSTDCGKGLQQRVVICMKSTNGNYQETFDADCSLDDKPAVRKDCNSNCVPSWFATPWTQVGIDRNDVIL